MATQIARHKLISRYLVDHPESASLILMKTQTSGIVDILNKVPTQHLTNCLSLFPVSVLAEIFNNIEEKQLVEIMEQLSPNKIAATARFLIQGDPSRKVKMESLFLKMKKECVIPLKKLLTFLDHSVGSIMNPIPFSVRENITVKELLKLLRKKKNRYSRYVYVVDGDECLLGVLPFKDAFYCEKESMVSELMTSNPTSLKAERNMREAFADSKWKEWDSLPVTDSKNRLLGVIRRKAIEEALSGTKVPDSSNTEIVKAGAAIGEVLQIAVTGTFSALGLDERK